MLQVNVVLPNGHSELLSLLPSSTVQDLKTAAKRAFGKKSLLVTAKNRVLLDPGKTLEEAEIEDGECLTALVLKPTTGGNRKVPLPCGVMEIVPNRYLGWCRGWRWQFSSSRSAQGCASDSGHKSWGLCCDSGRWICCYLGFMQAGAVTVRQFETSWGGCSRFKPLFEAFAAILADGSVVTWGDPDCGGDSSEVRDQLKGARQIQATHNVGLCGDSGRWIRRYLGSTNSVAVTVRKFEISSRVCSRFKPLITVLPLLRFWKMDPWLPGHWLMQSMAVTVQQFEISSGVCIRFRPVLIGAFAAILEDGSVVTWGHPGSGGDSFGSSRPAQGCAADSGHRWGLCCDSG